MDLKEMRYLYAVLRKQLDLAYAERPWDCERIDQIASDMLPLEEALAAEGIAAAGGAIDLPVSLTDGTAKAASTVDDMRAA